MPSIRIASLLAGSTEILYGLGLGENVVAISHECDFPPEAASKPRVTANLVNAAAASLEIDAQVRTMFESGSALYTINREMMTRLRPDLIVTQAQCDVCAVSLDDVRSLVADEPALAHTRIVAMNPTCLDELHEDIAKIAAAAGVSDRGTAYIASLKSRVAAISDATCTISVADRPRVCCIEWTDPVMVAANWVPELIDIAGGHCPLTRKGEHTRYTDWNDVTAFDPEVIVIAPCGFDLARTRMESQGLASRPDWHRLSAVRNDRVFAVDGNAYFNRTGPRLVDSLELLAGLIDPNRFGRFRETYSAAWCKLSL